MLSIDIVLILVIVLIVGIFIGSKFFNVQKFLNKKENLINLDDSRKVELSKCCTEPRCFSKPPHLRENCLENKENAKNELEKEFEQVYTQDEYYKKLNELDILKDLSTVERQQKLLDELNERIDMDIQIGEDLYNNIRLDDRDEVRGYDYNFDTLYTPAEYKQNI
jgi:hypothetical protein